MKNKVKNILRGVLGERCCLKLKKRLPAIRQFSENTLIYEYFLDNPRSGTMIDVGAHFGESLMPYLKQNWEIHAIEPDPRNARILAEKIDIGKICLHCVAISDFNGENVPFYTSKTSSGISSLSAFTNGHELREHVPTRTLSTIINERNIRRIDYLKIDAEGHDLQVLQGFPFDEMQPEVILCEFEDKKSGSHGYYFTDLAEFLQSKGFAVFVSGWEPIKSYGGDHRWKSLRQYPCELENRDAWGNLLASRNRRFIRFMIKAQETTGRIRNWRR